MIAKYNNNYFDIDVSNETANIWRFLPTDGFHVGVTRRGAKYYEKYLPVSEIEKIFNVSLQVEWNSFWWGVNGSYTEDFSKFYISTSIKKEAEKYGFKGTEIDRGEYVWWTKEISFEEITGFRIIITDIRTKENTIEDISFDEFKNYHREFIYNLSPWNFYNK